MVRKLIENHYISVVTLEKSNQTMKKQMISLSTNLLRNEPTSIVSHRNLRKDRLWKLKNHSVVLNQNKNNLNKKFCQRDPVVQQLQELPIMTVEILIFTRVLVLNLQQVWHAEEEEAYLHLQSKNGRKNLRFLLKRTTPTTLRINKTICLRL